MASLLASRRLCRTATNAVDAALILQLVSIRDDYDELMKNERS